MKKLIPIVAVALFGALTFSSCKKNYTCTCAVHFDSSSVFHGSDTTFKADYGKQKKKDAQNACNKMQNDAKPYYQAAGGDINCSL